MNLNMYIRKYKALELSDDASRREVTNSVAVEDTVELFVNKIPMASILATPEMLKELALGYVICEGIVRSRDEIKDCHIDDKSIYIEIEPSDHLELLRELRSSGCVGVRWEENEAISVSSDAVFKAEVIRRSLGFLDSGIYRQTRGTHAACLINTRGECVIKSIDVGRHNTFDKVVGRAYLEGIEPGGHFLVSTGRQSAGMVLKAARAGIPLVATKTAPLNSGVEAAERVGICLVCFVSPGKMSVFAHPERIK